MTVLVTGSRGSVARRLIPLLRERGLDVRPASSRPGEGAEGAVVCDLTDPATFPAALEGVRSVFLYAEPSQAAAFAGQAEAAGVEHIVLLSSASALEPDTDASPIARLHRDAERALEESGVRATHLRPGAFAGNALAWAQAIKAGEPIGLPYPGAHTDPLHEADLARAALAVLTDPALGGRPYTITGPRSITFTEQIETLSQVVGRPIEVRKLSEEEWSAEMAPFIPEEYQRPLLGWWREHDGVPVETTGAVRELTGRPALTFAEWAHEHAADFTG
ncbi:SDR family oxidoreductase [Nonomuraea longicatena]|uniref:NAD(P)H-binding protein n=1 Tax=Nonomuraea longicatena TaxID=83682 RepID=A0ABN1NWK1_9ACTN